MSRQPPKAKATLGLVSAALFENQTDGDGGPRLSVSLQRSYRKDDGWHTNVCYLTADTVSAAIAVLKAIETELLRVQSNDS